MRKLTDEDVLNLLELRPHTIDELCEKTGNKASTVYSKIKRLRALNKIKHREAKIFYEKVENTEDSS